MVISLLLTKLKIRNDENAVAAKIENIYDLVCIFDLLAYILPMWFDLLNRFFWMCCRLVFV